MKTYTINSSTATVTEAQCNEARNVLRRNYYLDVEGIAQDVIDAIASGEITDSDSLQEYLDQSVDGSARVIYTAQAQECLLFSDNDEAYQAETGEDTPAETSIQAFYAMRADVLEELDRAGLDVNDPCAEEEEEEDHAHSREECDNEDGCTGCDK